MLNRWSRVLMAWSGLVLAASLLGASAAAADITHAHIERARGGRYYVAFKIDHRCKPEDGEISDECPWFEEVDIYAAPRLCPTESTARGRIYIGPIWRFPMNDEESERIPRMRAKHIVVCLYVNEGGIDENVGEYDFRLAHFPR